MIYTIHAPVDMLHVDWERVQPLMETAVRRTLGEESATSIYLDAVGGLKQFWYAKEDDEIIGVVVTQLIVHVTGKKECRIVLVAGAPHTMKDWFVEMRDRITEWARGYGCHFIVGYGRGGWEKLFDNYAKKVYTVFAKQL